MASLDISIGDNVGDKITLYWRVGDPTVQYFRLYGSTVGDPGFVLNVLVSLIPNYPSEGPFRGSVVWELSRTALGITLNDPYYFRITEIDATGVESNVALSPTRGMMPEVGARYTRDVAVNAVVFPVNPQFNWGFYSQGFLLMNQGGVVEVEYSFDGVTAHGRLGVVGMPDNAKVFDKRHEYKIWLRLAAPGAVTVRVEVWDRVI